MDPLEAFRIAEEKFSTSLFIPPPTISISSMKEHLVASINKYRETKDLSVFDEHRKFINGLTSKSNSKENIPVAVDQDDAPGSKTLGRNRRKAIAASSNLPSDASTAESSKSIDEIKQERIVVDLPPPKEPVKRARKKKQTIKVEPRITRSSRSRRLDSTAEVESETPSKPIRVTRSTRNHASTSDVVEIATKVETLEISSENVKRIRSPTPSPLKKASRSKRTKVKTSSPKPIKTSIASVYEDARDSQSGGNSPTPAKSNETFVVEKKKSSVKQSEEIPTASAAEIAALFTDDESETNSVAVATPATKRTIVSSSTKKDNITDTIHQTLSKFKHTQQMLLERQQKRMEKEEEALKKREAILQKQSEDKRRKRLEKELKVRLQKESMEQAKKRLLEQQKEKDEKTKVLQIEKAERLAKQREDAENRRLMAKQKAEEVRKAELERKQKEEEEERKQQMKAQQKAKVAKYMIMREGLLPTADCYDSDDQAKSNKVTLPAWNRSAAMNRTLRTMEDIDLKLRNTLFNLKPQTPNLQDLFPGVDPKKLRRKSSAVWKQTPRFTMMTPFDV